MNIPQDLRVNTKLTMSCFIFQVLNGVSKIAMPRIGCGLDGMVWDKVHDLLNEVFSNENVEIVIYTFKG